MGKWLITSIMISLTRSSSGSQGRLGFWSSSTVLARFLSLSSRTKYNALSNILVWSMCIEIKTSI